MERSAPKRKKAARSVQVDAEKFTAAIRKMVESGPIKREDVKGENPKPGKVIQPHK